MKLEAKDVAGVTHHDNLVPSEAQKRALDVMDALALDMGAWQDHIPFEAALCFFEDDGVRKKYGEHVDSCSYCQGILNAMQPTEQAQTEFEMAVDWAIEHQMRGSRQPATSLSDRVKSLFGRDDEVHA